VSRELEAYELTRAYRLVADFANEDLSNWFVRRSRPRFWGNTNTSDARAAFRTLQEALVTIVRLTAPVTPFFSDWMHRALDGGESVHLAAWPEPDPEQIDPELEEEMEAVRALVTLGRSAREDVRIRVRQPLRALHAVLPGERRPRPELLEVLRDELNVKEVRFLDSAESLVRLVPRPNFRALGPRFQKASETAAQAIRDLDQEELRGFRSGEPVSIKVAGEAVPLEAEWLEVVEEAAGELVVKAHEGYAAALDVELDDELRAEGMARELVNRIQRMRKEAGLEITDRIRIGIEGGDPVREAMSGFRAFISGETLAVELEGPEAGAADPEGEWEAILDDEIDGVAVRLALRRAP